MKLHGLTNGISKRRTQGSREESVQHADELLWRPELWSKVL